MIAMTPDATTDMTLRGLQVLVTGGGRDTGRLLALAFAARGAHVFVTARDLAAAEETVRLIRESGQGSAEALVGDLASVDSVLGLVTAVARRTDHLDVLVNSGTRYLGAEAEVGDIVETIAGGATGTVLLTEHLLPLLRRSDRPDIVNLISACGEIRHDRANAHPAFYAMKHAQAGFADILSRRLRPEGIRVISLYPPDFVQAGPRTSDAELTAQSVVDCVLFAVTQPRDCFIRSFHFEQVG